MFSNLYIRGQSAILSLIESIRNSIKSFDLYDGTNRFLLLLLALIPVFLLFEILHTFGSIHIFTFKYFSINIDKGLTESYMYCLEFWIVLLLVVLTFQRRNPWLLVWVLTFGYYLSDDLFRFHEDMGRYIAANYDLSRFAYGPYNADPIGEFIYLSIVGVWFVSIFSTAYILGNAEFRRISKTLLKFLAALAFFAIIVDMAHSALYSREWRSVGAMIEEGGEGTVISLLVWYVFKMTGIRRTVSGADN